MTLLYTMALQELVYSRVIPRGVNWSPCEPLAGHPQGVALL